LEAARQWGNLPGRFIFQGLSTGIQVSHADAIQVNRLLANCDYS
jgi:hypothetical protein